MKASHSSHRVELYKMAGPKVNAAIINPERGRPQFVQNFHDRSSRSVLFCVGDFWWQLCTQLQELQGSELSSRVETCDVMTIV